MKRSSNISLVVMATFAFAASFAGGTAFLAWQKPGPGQNCTTAPDGTRTCASGGYGRYFGYSVLSGRTATAAPATPLAGSSSPPLAGTPTAASRGGFGASGRLIARASAAG
jgi:hypothetical protein